MQLTVFAARFVLLAVFAWVSINCSAPAQIHELQIAESQERAGNLEKALQTYRAAQTTCHSLSSARRRRDACAAAHMQYAELLVTMARYREAIAAYHHAETELADVPPAAAQASFSAALLYFRVVDTSAAYKALWHTVTVYPNQAFAADAVKTALLDGRKRAPKELFRQLDKLSEHLAHTEIADNLLYAMADLQENELRSPDKALHYYNRLVELHRDSGFYDDALWHSARLSLQLQDSQSAITRLQLLLDTREVAWGAGSYFSQWLDNAQLTLGVVLRDEFADFPAAIQALSQLPVDYPASLLKDDALYELAVTFLRASRTPDACRALNQLLEDFPDSKYELTEAPQLRIKLSCSL